MHSLPLDYLYNYVVYLPELAALTYCVAISVDRGLIFASDSRTNAGVDQISTYSKMQMFCGDGERMITVLSSGNLATTQAVVRRLRRDLENRKTPSLKSVRHLAEAADYVGELSLAEQARHKKASSDEFNPGVSFILGGQIKGDKHQIYLVYPEGNHIRASSRQPYLQIGELKYGKPILDRIIRPELSLDDAARCALVSMDSTIRSNLTVGPPIELQFYETGQYRAGAHLVFDEDHDYLRTLRLAWQDALQKAFEGLPALPERTADNVRLLSQPDDQ
jgi:putative proteasome-type protease